jgi:hypothetical protein
MTALGGAFVAALFLASGCSQNAGFGAPPAAPYPGPANQTQATTSPNPLGSGLGLASSGSPNPNASAASVLGVAGASARYAYDGADPDPAKAGRLVELAFAFRNPTNAAVVMTKVQASLDKDAVGEAPLKITAQANATSDVALVALRPKKDLAQAKRLNLAFLDDKDKIALQTSVDLPPTDMPFVPLDDKDPKGGTSIDGVEVSRVVSADSGLHYEITFALTNAGTSKVNIDGFTLTAPKSAAQKVHLGLTLPPRTTTGFISMILPFKGKALPNGDYLISAQGGNAVVAKSSGALL